MVHFERERLRELKEEQKFTENCPFPPFCEIFRSLIPGFLQLLGCLSPSLMPTIHSKLGPEDFLYNSSDLSSATSGKVCDSGNQLSLPEPSVHI